MSQGLPVLFCSAQGVDNVMIVYSVFDSLCPKEASGFGIRPFGQIASEIWSFGSLAIRGTCIVLKGTGCWTVLLGSGLHTFWDLYNAFTLMYDLSGMHRHWM